MIKRALFWGLIANILIFCNIGIAQSKIVVFSNDSEIRDEIKNQIKEKAKKYEIDLHFSEKIQATDFENTQAIGFWHFDEEKIDLEKNYLLNQFFKNNGGVLGLPGNLKSNYKWIWFENFFGTKTEQVNPTFSGDLISFYPSTHIGPSPIFNIQNATFEISKSPTIKPYIIDFQNNTLAFQKISEFGNKLFYLGIEPTESILENLDFEKALFGGIQNILGTVQSSDIFSSPLPNLSQFKADTVMHLDFVPQFVAKTNENAFALIDSSGTLYTLDYQQKTIVNLGTYKQLKSIEAIKADQEFDTNKYLYYFTKTDSDKSWVKRLKIDSIAVFDEFEQISSIPEANSINILMDENNLPNISLPKYYTNKTLRLNSFGKIEVLEFDTNQDKLIGKEPFIWNQGPIVSFFPNIEKNLLLFSNNKLLRLQYDSLGNFEPLISIQFTTNKTSKGKIINLSAESNMSCTYTWIVENKTYTGNKLAFPAKNHLTKLLVELTAQTEGGRKAQLSKVLLIP